MTTLKDQLGPLAGLIGTWTSPQVNPTGLNVMFVPSSGSKPNDRGAADLLVRPYRETLTFEVAAPPAARNRGGDVDQFVGAVAYKQVIYATDQDKEQLHAENGMFLYLQNKKLYHLTPHPTIKALHLQLPFRLLGVQPSHTEYQHCYLVTRTNSKARHTCKVPKSTHWLRSFQTLIRSQRTLVLICCAAMVR